MGRIGIKKRGPGAQLRNGSFLEFGVAGQAGTPLFPQRLFADHRLAIEVEALLPLCADTLLPTSAFV